MQRIPFSGIATVVLAVTLTGCATSRIDPEEEAFYRADLSVSVTGHDFEWRYVYPGRDGALGTADDLRTTGPLELPAGADVTLILTSDDYIYSFEVPEMGIRDIAVPDLAFSVRLEADAVRSYEVLGSQMCGYTHPNLLTTLHVRTPSQFANRMRRLESASGRKAA